MPLKMPMPRDSEVSQGTDRNSKICDPQSKNFYDCEVESYKSSTPISELLSSTFDHLHYKLSLNDHDKFIFQGN